MKVLLLNGSRREKGCTYTALSIVAEALGKHGIDTEIIHALPTDDAVSEVAEKLRTADGVVFGAAGATFGAGAEMRAPPFAANAVP